MKWNFCSITCHLSVPDIYACISFLFLFCRYIYFFFRKKYLSELMAYDLQSKENCFFNFIYFFCSSFLLPIPEVWLSWMIHFMSDNVWKTLSSSYLLHICIIPTYTQILVDISLNLILENFITNWISLWKMNDGYMNCKILNMWSLEMSKVGSESWELQLERREL